MRPWSNEILCLAEMIPYLGGEKYQTLLVMTRHYYKANETSKKVTDSGAPEDT